MKKIIYSLLCILHFTMAVQAQQMLGPHSGNHASIYRATFNPSAVAGSKYKWHINAVAFNTTINNRYFSYFRTDALFYPIKIPYSSSELYGKSKLTGSFTAGSNANIVTELRLPSVYFDVSKWLTLGISGRFRGFVQGSNVPSVLSDVYTKRLDFGNLVASSGTIKNFAMSQQTFLETGLTVAALALDLPEIIRIKLGATVKRLSAGRAAFLKINSANYAIRVLDKENAAFDLTNVNYEYGLTNTVQNFDLNSLFSDGYGSGWAYDLGATIELGQIKNHADYRANYIARIGIAMTDAGSISYPTNGKIYIGTLAKTTLNQDNIVAIGDNSTKALQAILPATNAKNYTLSTQLPTTLNLDLDLHLAKSFFLNATLIKPTQTGTLPTTIQQPQILSIIPRFEDADAEFTLPISWIEGNSSPTVGMSARIGPVFIGFSNLSGMLKIHEPRGTFLYFGLQFWKMRK
jgi:Family of unknown function (DUF5723)